MFVVSAVLAGVAGALYAPQVGIITPARMGVLPSIEMVVWVAAGGRGTLVGAVLGAIGVNWTQSWLTTSYPDLWLLFLGALFMGVVLFFPDGVLGAAAAPRLPPARHRGDCSRADGARRRHRAAPRQAMTTDAIVYLEDVIVDYDGFKALNGVNFFMDRRELRVVIGPNGAGKTTLLDVISGRVKPASGRVIFGHHTDLVALRENEIAALGVGRKFQTPSVFVNLTVRDNIELSLRRASKGVLRDAVRPRPGRRRAAPASSRRWSGSGSPTRPAARPARCPTARSSGSRSAW